MPGICLLLLLSLPLPTDLKHTPFLHLHFHLLLLQPREVGLEHVCILGLLPVETCSGKG
ncbi:hypothetical protein M5K25_011782 [Dendrobium thyrsiflorum]|uniref:Uncharacterized protein n=1 Tax=Dendrobium thyrsiflorum TaxID=117978 RepID=A0ABD0V380_DENTH